MLAKNIHAVDLFCGIGGLTYGLRKAGIEVKAGVDNDWSCKNSYVKNNRGVDFIFDDVKKINAGSISTYYNNADIKVLVGCAPCQPFSSHTNKNRSRSYTNKSDDCSLLLEFFRIVKKCRPDIISIENVVGLKKHDVFNIFLNYLKKMGYRTSVKIVSCPEYGIPQTRKRLVLLASMFGEIELIPPTHKSKSDWPTVECFIKGMPSLKHGTQSKTDSCHLSLKLNGRNIERIKQSKPGGSWSDWDKGLVSDCHKKSYYPAPYGRMRWDRPAPTITTQFCYYSTGRFGHPSQNRAISLREGALLQTFPPTYQFQNKVSPLTPRQIARHIGNAVPVKLGEVIGHSIRRHIDGQ